MKKDNKKLIDIIREIKPLETCNKTNIEYLNIYRFETKEIKMPKIENPYLYLVIDGEMRLYTPSGIMDYMAGQYSISAIDTPKSAYIIDFSEQKDFLALSIEFTIDDVISVMIELNENLIKKIMNLELSNESMLNADNNVVKSIIKLFSAMNEKEQLEFLEKHIKREVIFNVICGSCGKQFIQSITNTEQIGEIYEINSWIKENYKNTFPIEELAKQKNMSVSNFHKKFKNAVGMGALQCQKRLRLTEARRLMLDKNMNVTEVSMNVGYESMSQFIRDYKKMFGKSPKDDIQNLREHLKEKTQSN